MFRTVNHVQVFAVDIRIRCRTASPHQLFAANVSDALAGSQLFRRPRLRRKILRHELLDSWSQFTTFVQCMANRDDLATEVGYYPQQRSALGDIPKIGQNERRVKAAHSSNSLSTITECGVW